MKTIISFYPLIYYIMWRHKKIRPNDWKPTVNSKQMIEAKEELNVNKPNLQCKWWCCPASKDCPNPTPWCCEWCPKDFVPTDELDEKLKALLSTPSSDLDVDYKFYRWVFRYILLAFVIVVILYLVKWLF